MSRAWLKTLVPPLGILVAYFVIPVNADDAPVGVVAGLVLAVAALGVVSLMIFNEARRAERQLTAPNLVLALQVALIVFSFIYYALEVNDPGEFAQMETRLDALYFSMTTAATVGYGDIHAVGQVSRALVIVHMIFNLVFIGALVSLARDRVSEHRTLGRHAAPPGDEPVGDEG